VKSLTDEIRWFGGYKPLLDLLVMYVAIIIVIMVVWVIWSFWLSWFHKSHRGKSLPPVTEEILAVAFAVDVAELGVVKTSKKVTVQFDENAKILQLQRE
jgi:poly-beta-1,6-N-acetyl-D-glucosamine biosynthesis protein PgaD